MINPEATSSTTQISLLVCPLCKGHLQRSPASIICSECDHHFPQDSEHWVDLLPGALVEHDTTEWQDRLSEMEGWYDQLRTDLQETILCFENNFQPFETLLSTVSGTILDLGGGNGLIRHYLPAEVKYISIDPSIDWLDRDWKNVANKFPCLNAPPDFVRGVGEHLPFPPKTFDTVLAFWSLNHVSNPEKVFREVWTVLKPGGTFIAVLEDMRPKLRDLLNQEFLQKAMFQIAWIRKEYVKSLHPRLRTHLTRDNKRKQLAIVLLSILKSHLPGHSWPTQDDHIFLKESDLRKWSRSGFEVVDRSWIEHYLTYTFRKAEV